MLVAWDKTKGDRAISTNSDNVAASQASDPESAIDLEFLRSLTILYVEDEDEVREGLARFLRRRFGRVDTAANGKEGLEKFVGARHDIVVTDVKMPVMDGLEMAVSIKRIQKEVPVIVVTAYNETDYFMRAIEVGVDRYVKKPIDPEVLVDAIQRSVRIRFQQRELQRALQRERDTMIATVDALARAIEKRDLYTDGHQKRVADLAVSIGQKMGLAEDIIRGIHFGALIHEIGNIIVPAEIISSARKLSPAEFELVKKHPQAGFEIVAGIDFPWPVGLIMLQHHERCDGSGYPSGLKAGEILLEAKIVGVANVVDAMLSHRPYRHAHPIEAVFQELRSNRGKLYDPSVVDSCIAVLEARAVPA